MRSLVPVVFAVSSTLHAASGSLAPSPKKIPIASMLPNGSELQGVMIPRHDENHRLISSLKAETITLVNEETIAGKQVTLSFYHANGTQRGYIYLPTATIDQSKGLLRSLDPVIIDSEKFHARGNGIYYSLQVSDGFLIGPAVTWIQSTPETTMNSSRSLISAAGIALISQTASGSVQSSANKPAPTSEALASQTAALTESRGDLRKDLDASLDATQKVKKFLDEAEHVAKNTTATPPAPEPKPLDAHIGPQDTVISSDGGMYFDAAAGVIVYLKNVRITDPRFALEGANELKIFLTKKPEDPNKPEAKKNPSGLGMGAKFGDVDKIIATGAVRILQKEVKDDKAPVEASGAIFTYHPKSGEILLSGGYPWVKQGSNFMRAKEPNLTLRIQKSGSFVTEGNWDMGGTLKSD